MKKKTTITLISLLVLVLIPFPTTVVPEWKVQIVDENGTPHSNQFVRQSCMNYTLDTSCGEDSRTDADGFVTFSKKTIWMGFLMRAISTAYSYAALIAHGSVGSIVSIGTTGAGGHQTLDYVPNKPLPAKFVLKQRSPQE